MTSIVSKQKINLTEVLLAPHKNSEKICFLTADSQISYRQLYQNVTKISFGFQQLGIKTGMSVVVGLNDSIASAEIFLSCCAIGARPLLVNPKLDQPTLQHLLDTAEAVMYISEQNSYIQFEALTDDCRSCDYHMLLQNNGSDELVFNYQSAEAACFFQSTSGSTGRPKLVTHTAYSALSCAEQVCRQWLDLNGDQVFYSVAKLFFGYGMGNSLLFPLFLGATSVLDNEWPTPLTVSVNLLKYKPTVFCGVPAIYQGLLESAIAEGALDSVKLALSAGSQLPEKLFHAYQAYGIELLDGIGATELCHIFIANTPNKAQPGETGYPLPGYQVKLVNDKGDQVATGEVGSLMIKGPSLASGYWRNENATTKKFNAGWYDSGDMFKQNQGGALIYKGRTDDLFKVNGRWVNPIIIEAAILVQFETLTEATIVPYQVENGLTYGFLFFTTKDDVNFPTDNLLNWCRETFPSYRSPTDLQQLNKLPRNTNGKLDRRALSVIANHTVTDVHRKVS